MLYVVALSTLLGFSFMFLSPGPSSAKAEDEPSQMLPPPGLSGLNSLNGHQQRPIQERSEIYCPPGLAHVIDEELVDTNILDSSFRHL
jgi:hypothetical protein